MNEAEIILRIQEIDTERAVLLSSLIKLCAGDICCVCESSPVQRVGHSFFSWETLYPFCKEHASLIITSGGIMDKEFNNVEAKFHKTIKRP